MTIGDRIKVLREEEKLTQDELAKYIDTTKQTIHKYENNIVTNIPSDKIVKISEILNCTPAYLMGWTEEKTVTEKSSYDLVNTPLYTALSKLDLKKDDLTPDEINNKMVKINIRKE